MSNKKKKGHGKVTFKPYDQDQMWLLPPSLNELIGPNHIVRLVNRAIDQMDLDPILNTYEGGGASNYHPRVLLKALVYGYIEKIYSSRAIEKALKENICFMWLCGMQSPDHNTLNRFRNGILKTTVKDVFSHVLVLLIEQGYVRLNDYYVDGSKIEAVSNRYTAVWAKNVARYKTGLLEKIQIILEQIESHNEEAEEQSRQASTQKTTEKIEDSEALAKTVIDINQTLSEQLDKDKNLRRKVDKLKNEHLPKLQGYEEQERLLKDRNSYSKTDPDATMMRMKEDHLGTGQLKPAYNIQIGTEDQFIVGYSVHQNAGDATLLIPHLEQTHQMLQAAGYAKPKRIGADGAYGSEQNYDYLEFEDYDNYVKFPGYYHEQKRKHKNNIFHRDNLFYNRNENYFVCPMGQKLTLFKTGTSKTKTGYEFEENIYKAQRCQDCPLRGQCHQSSQDRQIRIRPNLERHKQQARKNLNSLRGIRMRKKRSVDVEPVFGHIKTNRKFNRFMLRSVEKVSVEMGILAIAHNLKKWWKKIEQGISVPIFPTFPPNETNRIAKTMLFLKFLPDSFSKVSDGHVKLFNFETNTLSYTQAQKLKQYF